VRLPSHQTERSQMNQFLCKVLCHNIFVVIQFIYELGIVSEFFAKESAVAD
jgi:hypothetical protein